MCALIVGSGTAYAANGGSFRLGLFNSATKATVLTNSNGTALDLRSKAGTPSLKVNRTTKVPRLNADLIDGRHESAFALASGQVGSLWEPGFPLDVTNDGVPDNVAAIATCPRGSKMTGGGGGDFTADGTLFLNGPLDNSSWVVVSTAANPTDPNVYENVEAYVQCWNPRGAVAGSTTRAQSRGLAENSDVMKKLRARVSR